MAVSRTAAILTRHCLLGDQQDFRRKMKRTRAGRRPARRSTRRHVGHGLHALALRLEQAREEERARVARELHDELGQVLTSLKLEFMWLVDQLRNNEPKPGHSARQQTPVAR